MDRIYKSEVINLFVKDRGHGRNVETHKLLDSIRSGAPYTTKANIYVNIDVLGVKDSIPEGAPMRGDEPVMELTPKLMRMLNMQTPWVSGSATIIQTLRTLSNISGVQPAEQLTSAQDEMDEYMAGVLTMSEDLPEEEDVQERIRKAQSLAGNRTAPQRSGARPQIEVPHKDDSLTSMEGVPKMSSYFEGDDAARKYWEANEETPGFD